MGQNLEMKMLASDGASILVRVIVVVGAVTLATQYVWNAQPSVGHAGSNERYRDR